MSSALPKDLQQEHLTDNSTLESPPVPLSELANGLHAMAQPLTILRGAMCALTLHDEIAPASRRYLDMSTKQVDRLCDLMSSMQNLLHAAQSHSKLVSFDLAELLDSIVDQQRGAASESGVRIALAKPKRALRVFAEEHGVEQAFNAALKTTISLARPNDQIEIETGQSGGLASIAIRNERFAAGNLGSFERFHLTVIEAIIRRQGGDYKFIDIPFCISLSLRIAKRPGAQVTSDCMRMAV